MSEETIHILLFKHFLSETSIKEEQIIARFRSTHKEEYAKLKKIWQHKGQIDIQDFDSVKAWGKINAEVKKKPVSIIPLKRKFAWVAACVMLVLMTKYATDIFSFWNNDNQETYVSKTNTTEEALAVNLSDGSVIWLNKFATLSFPEQFEGDSRKVALTGEAFFDIKKNPDLPFIISTQHSEVTVLGTSFNIDAVSGHTEILVKTGKVKVTSIFSENSIEIIKGQGAVVSTKELTSFPIADNNFLAWKNGQFEFTQAPISNVVKALNEYYDNQISVKNSSLTCLLTTTFNQLPLSDVMQIIQLSCDFKIKQTNSHYEIY